MYIKYLIKQYIKAPMFENGEKRGPRGRNTKRFAS